MKIFSKLFAGKTKANLGIDIGSSGIKLVEISQVKQRFELENYAFWQNPDQKGNFTQEKDKSAVSSLRISDPDTADIIKDLMGQAKIKSRQAIISLPVFVSFSATLQFPQAMTREEIKQALPFEAKKYVPVPLEEVELDWTIVGQIKTEKEIKQKVFLIAVSKDLINRYYKVAQLAGLQIKSLELETFALMRALIGQDPSPFVLVDVGARNANFAIVKNNTLAWDYNVNLRLWQEQRQFSPAYDEQSLGILIDRLHYFIKAYQAENKHELNKGIVCGGVFLKPKLFAQLKQEFKQINLTLANPFARLLVPEALKPLLPELSPLLAVAIGAGMRD